MLEFRTKLHERLRTRNAPFQHADPDAASRAIERLTSVDPQEWGAVWIEAAKPFTEIGDAREAIGDRAGAREAYFNAYALAHVGRYPTPNHPSKLAAYEYAVASYRAAGRFFDPPLEIVKVPFEGRPGEGDAVTFYIRRPHSATRPPVVVRCGGIDTWKEEQIHVNEALLGAGFASINVDMPGVGESPVKGSLDAERQFLPIFDWIEAQPDLDADRIIFVGMSYGGYWSTKVAHLHAHRLVGAVNWGGGIDQFFSREWLERSANASSYLMDLGAARARSVGVATYAEYADRVQGFSLLEQGILDNPHPPMLVVNGRHDEQAPFDDMILLSEHGRPKAMRFFPGGHMGYGPDTIPTVITWLSETARTARETITR
jgi:pimeloyl-ACP methyl ester carboxylesterase